MFMDFRCTEGFASPLVILYGHNMKDGSMLAPLSRAAREGGDALSEVSVTLPDGRTKTYDTFAIRRLDAFDPVFSLPGRDGEAIAQYCAELGAPENCDILALTTCSGGPDKDTYHDHRQEACQNFSAYLHNSYTPCLSLPPYCLCIHCVHGHTYVAHCIINSSILSITSMFFWSIH